MGSIPSEEKGSNIKQLLEDIEEKMENSKCPDLIKSIYGCLDRLNKGIYRAGLALYTIEELLNLEGSPNKALLNESRERTEAALRDIIRASNEVVEIVERYVGYD